VKPVAQRLGIDERGYVEFYLLNGNIVVRKGDKEYDPNDGKTGFYMGTGIVDKENRTTLIKLVVQNLQINSKGMIDFFLFRDEIVIRESVSIFQQRFECDERLLKEEDKERLSKVYERFQTEIVSFVRNHGTNPTKLKEMLAKIQEDAFKDALPQARKTIMTSLIMAFRLLTGPKDMKTVEDKALATLLTGGDPVKENLGEQVELFKRATMYTDRIQREGGFGISEKKKAKIREECGLELVENGHSLRMKKK
jgi:hypothetical protein